MKYVRVPFSLELMRTKNGIHKKHVIDMLNHFPDDTSIIGFGRNDWDMINYMFLYSEKFADIPTGNVPPDIQVLYRRFPDGTVVCEGTNPSFKEGK